MRFNLLALLRIGLAMAGVICVARGIETLDVLWVGAGVALLSFQAISTVNLSRRLSQPGSQNALRRARQIGDLSPDFWKAVRRRRDQGRLRDANDLIRDFGG